MPQYNNKGSQSQGCYIEYNSLITDYYSGNITIVRTSVDTTTSSKCVTGIYTSNYNVTFYDMDYNNVPYTTEYAVKLTNQLVTGLSFPHYIAYQLQQLTNYLCLHHLIVSYYVIRTIIHNLYHSKR